jgi:membrane protease YdiL (CAAX protease family)
MFLRISVFYVLTWFFVVLLGGIQQETGLLPPEIGLPQWGPGIAALFMLVIFRKDGFKITFLPKGASIQRYFAALLPVGAGLVVYLISSVIPMVSTPIPDIFDNLPLVLFWMPLGALGEELGWRGYLHKKLDTRMNGLSSSLLVGIMWMLFHVHFLGQGPVFLLFFAIVLTSQSILLYALTRDTGFSVLLATIFHWAFNLINLTILDVIYETSYMMVSGIVWAIVAAVVVFMKRDLFFAPKG